MKRLILKSIHISNFGMILLLGFLITMTQVAVGKSSPGAYLTPQPFMDLYFDFTGNNNPNYPKDKINISQTLIQSEQKQQNNHQHESPSQLILFMGSSLYVYDQNGKNILTYSMRTAPNSGFFEMTAISHIGPALAYLIKVKNNGDKSWRPQLENLLKDIKAVKTINYAKENNWLDQVDVPAWKPHLSEIHDMVNYACDMSEDYISRVLSGKIDFNKDTVEDNFLEGNKQYPIPYNNVMIATFMLTALHSMSDIYSHVTELKVTWPNAKVLIHFVVGTNVTAGVSAGSNWIVPLLYALSNDTLPHDRVFIAPYAEVRPTVGKNQLSKADYSYYANSIWGKIYTRTKISNDIFSNIPEMPKSLNNARPGDYAYSSKVSDFIIRLKYSLAQPTEMLSNTVAFWMAGELLAKHWDYTKVQIPGLTSGFPHGITRYPSS